MRNTCWVIYFLNYLKQFDHIYITLVLIKLYRLYVFIVYKTSEIGYNYLFSEQRADKRTAANDLQVFNCPDIQVDSTPSS